MRSWQPSLYLEFEKERTQPSIDLVGRIDIDTPTRIIDIGCGPGNSTCVLRSRWPMADIIGLDNSNSMLEKAKVSHPDMKWVLANAADDLSYLGTFDIVFSNAAIQWIPNQQSLLQRLFAMLNRDGILAIQVPYVEHMPLHVALVQLATSNKWQGRFETMRSPYSMHSVQFYYNILRELSSDFEIWETNYYHIMDSYQALVKWSGGSALRPYLEHINDNFQVKEFIQEYEHALEDTYPMQPDGRILLPFTRIFFIARKRL